MKVRIDEDSPRTERMGKPADHSGNRRSASRNGKDGRRKRHIALSRDAARKAKDGRYPYQPTDNDHVRALIARTGS